MQAQIFKSQIAGRCRPQVVRGKRLLAVSAPLADVQASTGKQMKDIKFMKYQGLGNDFILVCAGSVPAVGVAQ